MDTGTNVQDRSSEALAEVVGQLKHQAFLTEDAAPSDVVWQHRRTGKARVPAMDILLSCLDAELHGVNHQDYNHGGKLDESGYKAAMVGYQPIQEGLIAAAAVVRNLRRQGVFPQGRTRMPPHLLKIRALRDTLTERTAPIKAAYQRHKSQVRKDERVVREQLGEVRTVLALAKEHYKALDDAYNTLDTSFEDGNPEVKGAAKKLEVRPTIDTVIEGLDAKEEAASDALTWAGKKNKDAQNAYGGFEKRYHGSSTAISLKTDLDDVESLLKSTTPTVSADKRERRTTIKSVLKALRALEMNNIGRELSTVIFMYGSVQARLRAGDFSAPDLPPTTTIDSIRFGLDAMMRAGSAYPKLAGKYHRDKENLDRAIGDLQSGYNAAVRKLREEAVVYLNQSIEITYPALLRDYLSRVTRITTAIDAAEQYRHGGVQVQDVLTPEERRQLYDFKAILERAVNQCDSRNSGGDLGYVLDQFRTSLANAKYFELMYGINYQLTKNTIGDARQYLTRLQKAPAEEPITDPRVAKALPFVIVGASYQPRPDEVEKLKDLERRRDEAERKRGFNV